MNFKFRFKLNKLVTKTYEIIESVHDENAIYHFTILLFQCS